jgi:alanyl aminopeptidase
MTRVISTLGALVLTAGWASAPPAEAARLGHQVVPTSQAVELEVDADQDDYRGTVRISLDVRETTDRFRLHARDMELRTVTLEGPGGAIPVSHETLDEQQVLIRAETPLAPGPHTLTIGFRGPFNTQAVALYRMEQDGLGYAFTQFEASDARGAFPCFDEPGFKIPWQLTVRVPEAHIAVTNTPVETQATEDGWTTYVFRETKPLPSYLIALATGPLDTVEMPGLGVPARIVTPKGQTGLTTVAIEQTPPILKALEAYFGEPYPYEKLDYIAIPEYWPGAMENPGAITYASSMLLLDPASASLAQRRLLAKVIAHELAHMWFGDKVTMQWWDDLWLNESFADWMGDKITPEVFPELRMDLEVIRDAQGVMGSDARPTASAIRRPVESTDTLLQDVGVQYNKGKAVLGMFEAWIGPEVFRKGVLDYMAANAWGNATADDLWKALDAASEGKVSGPLATFVDQPGLPIVSVEPLGEGRVRLTQRRFGSEGVALAPQTWSIPVALRYTAGGEARTRAVLLDTKTTDIDLGAGSGEVYPKADGQGYYRWQVSDETLMQLTKEAGRVLSDAERMDLVGNLSALLSSGTLDGGRYLAALEGLAADPEPMVVGSVLDSLSTVRRPFVPAGREDEFASFVRRTLRPALDRVGFVPREDETETATLVRPRLLGWLGDIGRDPEIRGFAAKQASAYLAAPDSVPPSIASTCLRLAAIDGTAEQFDTIRERFEATEQPAERDRYLQALGAFREPALVDRALDYAFSGPLRANELFSLPAGLTRTAAGSDRAFRWMTENYATLAERLPPEFMGFMPFFAGGCSTERLESARVFFAKPEHQVEGTPRMLGRVSAQVDECLALRSREGESAHRFLRESGS